MRQVLCRSRLSWFSATSPTSASLSLILMVEKYSANHSSNQSCTRVLVFPFSNSWAYSWKTTGHGLGTDRSSRMKLTSAYAKYHPAAWVGLPCHNGVNSFISLLLRNATTCSGAGRVTFACPRNLPNNTLICSKRRATSRPLFSPASVRTEKCGDLTSTHAGPVAPAKGGHTPRNETRPRT